MIYNRRMKDDLDGIDTGKEVDEDVAEIMESQDLDQDTAERVRDVMEEYGVDEDEAVELEEAGIE